MEEPGGTARREEVRVTQAAGILSLGNLASRVLGFVRGMVRAYLFGGGGEVSALAAALRIPTMIYDLLVENEQLLARVDLASSCSFTSTPSLRCP